MKRTILCSLLILAFLFPSIALAKYDFEYTSTKQLLKVCDLAVLGKPIAETRQGDSGSIYKIAVDKLFWGKEIGNLDLYTSTGLLDVGQNYILFIEHDDDIFWIGPEWQLVDNESFFRVSKGKIEVPQRFTDLKNNISVSGFGKRVSSLKRSVKPKATVPAIVETLAINELIVKSDNIFIGKVLKVEYSSKVAAGSAIIQVAEPLKGVLDRVQIHIFVPQGVEAGQTYLFFRSQGMNSIPSRSNSVLKQGSSDYDEVLQQLRYPQNRDRAENVYENLYASWIKDSNSNNYPYDFAGSWITEDNHLAISLVNASEVRKKEIAVMSKDPGVIVFFDAKYTYNELYDLAQKILNSYGGNPASEHVPVEMTSVNQQKNLIDIKVLPKYLETASAYFFALYGDKVEVTK
ncbi:MAG TPA: hypothetical protein VM577_16375 [Anaerovoracaceae bacterium]|nr:hypothetical protein [Anaerovoracaceae bacterium]